MTFDPSLPFTPPYLFGVYLATRALPGACLLVDGPDCSASVAENYFANHDWQNPQNAFPYASLATTRKNLQEIALGDETKTRRTLRELAQNPELRLVFVMGSGPLAMLGVQHREVTRAMAAETGIPMIDLPSKELHADWVSGYQDVLLRLAESLQFPAQESAAKKPERVALIGYFFDRYEGEHRANLAEIERLLAGLGLELGAVWLNGQDPEELLKVAAASWLIALPAGRRAAGVLSKRLGIPQIKAPLPLGIEATERFLRVVATATEREGLVSDFVAGQERAVLKAPEFAQARWFQERRVAISADPHHLEPLCEFFTFMGARVVALSTNAVQCPEQRRLEERYALPVHLANTLGSSSAYLREAQQVAPLDLAVGDSMVSAMARDLGISTLEFGFPSFYSHFLSDAPFYGYTGFVKLVERAITSQLQAEFIRHPQVRRP